MPAIPTRTRRTWVGTPASRLRRTCPRTRRTAPAATSHAAAVVRAMTPVTPQPSMAAPAPPAVRRTDTTAYSAPSATNRSPPWRLPCTPAVTHVGSMAAATSSTGAGPERWSTRMRIGVSARTAAVTTSPTTAPVRRALAWASGRRSATRQALTSWVERAATPAMMTRLSNEATAPKSAGPSSRLRTRKSRYATTLASSVPAPTALNAADERMVRRGAVSPCGIGARSVVTS